MSSEPEVAFIVARRCKQGREFLAIGENHFPLNVCWSWIWAKDVSEALRLMREVDAENIIKIFLQRFPAQHLFIEEYDFSGLGDCGGVHEPEANPMYDQHRNLDGIGGIE